jgi:hypothetical protein
VLALAAACAGAPPRARSYADVPGAVEAIHEGSKAADVLALLGEPAEKDGSSWSWTFREWAGFPGLPPPAGTTVIAGALIEVEDGVVRRVRWAFVDATGPPPR